MIPALQAILQKEKIYFAGLRERMHQFSGQTARSAVHLRIAAIYSEAYNAGIAALYHYENAIGALAAGNADPIRPIAGAGTESIPNSAIGRELLSILAAQRPPSSVFRAKMRAGCRLLVADLLSMGIPDHPVAVGEVETIGALLVSFEHLELEPKKESSGGSGLLAFGAGALAAIAGQKVLAGWTKK